MLEIDICEVRGHCPVHRVGDKITHTRGADPVQLGLSKPKDQEHAYIQCVDPGEPYNAA